MRRALAALVLAVVLGLPLGAPAARAAEWHSETPVAAGIGIPAPLGEVGDIEFWAPNRGVLITAGNKGIPAGVYGYDGSGWHLYSTVCGGHHGSIAWAGPDEFWTVSDYAVALEGAENASTLCHFKDGEVIASYAEPPGTADTFRKMLAAACNGPADCWFAGEPLAETAPNFGPFHLHWDGGALTAIPSQTEAQPEIEDPKGKVTDLEFLGGSLFESVDEAPFLREVNLALPQVFAPVPVPVPAGAEGPFALAGDGAQLWAVARNGKAVLRSVGLGFETVPLNGELPAEVTALAAEPGGAAVWVGGARSGAAGAMATATRVSADGTVEPAVTLPLPGEELDGKGGAAAISCPSFGQCWLVTGTGWLFHLGGPLEADADPAMHALITFRPPDNSTRTFVPPGVPEDNSGETEPRRGPSEEPLLEPFPERRRQRTLVTKVKQRVIGKNVLELSFVLHARAHVQLLAKYHRKVVAKTPRLTLGSGPHRLRLRLDPKRWPTGLDFEVHPAGRRRAR
jgi:hypothetical protein